MATDGTIVNNGGGAAVTDGGTRACQPEPPGVTVRAARTIAPEQGCPTLLARRPQREVYHALALECRYISPCTQAEGRGCVTSKGRHLNRSKGPSYSSPLLFFFFFLFFIERRQRQVGRVASPRVVKSRAESR